MSANEPVLARGRCLCGAVTYAVHGKLREQLSVCHCHMCRRHHAGAGIYTSAAKADVEIDGGTALRWYESSPGIKRGFCAACGSSLFWTGDNYPNLDIASGSLDASPRLVLGHHIFVAHKGDYEEIADDLPKYPDNPPDPS
ncbi:MAG: GFA family protein [Dongiaceae bacterium]